MALVLCDEADHFEEEPDFTCADATERCSKLVADKVPHKNVEYVVLSRMYRQEELTPTLPKDPACNPKWPLAAYWPVYVANFKTTCLSDEVVFEEVSKFFAHNGLLTRMIFPGNRVDVSSLGDGFTFNRYQRNSMLFDMLVYFVSKEDAERAIATCHHVSYYGYKLTVLPGRVPVYYDETRSIKVPHIEEMYPEERQIEEDLSRNVSVNFVGRYPNNSVGVEFHSTEDMFAAIGAQTRWGPQRMAPNTMKQRFIEGKVTDDIRKTIEADPSWIHMKPGAVVLRWLLEGYRPFVNLDWQNHTAHVMTDTNLDYLRLKEKAEQQTKPETREKESEKKELAVLKQIEMFKAKFSRHRQMNGD